LISLESCAYFYYVQLFKKYLINQVPSIIPLDTFRCDMLYHMIKYIMIWYDIISYYFITNRSWVELNIFPCAAPPSAVSATGCLALGVLESRSRSRSASSSAEIWIWLEGAGPKQNTNRSQTTARESLKTENENAQKLITIRPGGSSSMENTKHPYLTWMTLSIVHETR